MAAVEDSVHSYHVLSGGPTQPRYKSITPWRPLEDHHPDLKAGWPKAASHPPAE